MEPLRQAAKEGVVMECADGRQQHIYPIPAAFEGDWPKQCGMASAEEGSCPVCEQDYDHQSDYPNLAPLRMPNRTLAALCAYFQNDKDPGELKSLQLKPWWPWWAFIPYMNFHASIMPDLLHQLYQGMLKMHVITWTKKLHMKAHYYYAIHEMGTPDSYNMELPEHLHIIYAKRGWRASSKVCPLPQMMKFIQHYEALWIHCMYIDAYYSCQAQDHVESQVVYGEDEDAILKGVGRRLLREDEDLDKDLMENEQSEGADEANEQDCEDEPKTETEG
ncbi:hypothetical protein FRC11_009131 [Ceratobasidium sp. 423]|nr:hypothetical protein FRC11_009131 [Ceratobasidium sp. 423]